MGRDEERVKIYRDRLKGNTFAKGNAGKPKSESHRKAIGDAHRGKKLTEAQIEKLKGNKYGRGSKGSKEKSEACLGTRWVNNGYTSLRIKKKKGKHLPEGYVYGRITYNQ